MEGWDVVSFIFKYAVYPLMGGVTFFMTKQINKLETVEKRQQHTEVRISVVESKVDDLRDDIKEIKANVQKLVERK